MPMAFGLDYPISFLIDPLAFDLDLSTSLSVSQPESLFKHAKGSYYSLFKTIHNTKLFLRLPFTLCCP